MPLDSRDASTSSEIRPSSITLVRIRIGSGRRRYRIVHEFGEGKATHETVSVENFYLYAPDIRKTGEASTTRFQ